MIRPSKSPVTLPFGATTDPYRPAAPHNGVDFAYIPDNTIYAPFTGVVKAIPNNNRDGNAIYMTDADGRFHGLLHMSNFLVSDGAYVQEGQPIGIMGDTGYAFGVHLHWCVRVSGKFIDPLTLVKEQNMQQPMGSGTVDNVYLSGWQRPATAEEHKMWDNKPMDGPDGLFYTGMKAQFQYLNDQVSALEKQVGDLKTQLSNGQAPAIDPHGQLWRELAKNIKETNV